MNCEKGFSLIETVVALALLGIIAVAFQAGICTGIKANMVADKQSIAESLVCSQAEYIKNHDYQYSVTEYPVDPNLDIPNGWNMPPPTVEPVHDTDDGIQKIMIIVEQNGEQKLSAEMYKMNR